MQQHHALEAYSFSGRTNAFSLVIGLIVMILVASVHAQRTKRGGGGLLVGFCSPAMEWGVSSLWQNIGRRITLVISWKTRKKIGNRFSSVEKSVIPVYQEIEGMGGAPPNPLPPRASLPTYSSLPHRSSLRSCWTNAQALHSLRHSAPTTNSSAPLMAAWVF